MKHTGTLRLLVVLLSVFAIAGGLLGVAQAQQRHVLLLDVDGMISPVTERFIERGVRRAEEQGSLLIVVRIDTPGGLLGSTRKITTHLLEADVPSVVYVAPRGARAASAGTFIAASANFAVMAPGTNIGAASPVGAGGEDLPETLKSKVTEDAAADMRSIASLRGRNAEKLEATVLEALSFTAEEAVESGMVDFIAGDMDELLALLHGQEAIILPPDGRRVILDTQGITVRTMEMSMVERFLRFLSDPNVSFMLLSLGSLGIFVELLNPGLVLPGVVGGILLVLAFITLGNLPVNWGGAVLILLAVALGLLEFYVAGFGVLGIGAVVCFILGGLFLFFHAGAPSPTMPDVRVSLWVLTPTVLVLGIGGGWAAFTIVRSRKEQPEVGVADLVGQIAEVTTDLAPRGTVRLENQLWTAVAEGSHHIGAGEKVEVVKVDGIILTVARPDETQQPAEATQ
ncbi:MAG: nodulation protein NfeD [Dehalococcoidia bacterium]